MTHIFPGLEADGLSDNEEGGAECRRVTPHSGAHIQSTLLGLTVDSSGPECAKSGHSGTICEQVKSTFKADVARCGKSARLSQGVGVRALSSFRAVPKAPS
jgi:hypothetical protein